MTTHRAGSNLLRADNHRLWMYKMMVKSRHLENLLKLAFLEGKTPVFNLAKGPIPGEMHLSDGQEPCAVGICAHLRREDVITATHRPHHIAVAKGVNLNAMVAEIFGKKAGLSGGRGGHMHLFDPAVNFSCSGIVAEGLGPAVGAALAGKFKKTDHVAVAYLGEGAANQGAFHEALNLASVWKAPVIFVIEDNAYGISVSKRDCTSVKSNADRAVAYGMPGIAVADNDPDLVHKVGGEAIARARRGEGPSLIEIQTDRLAGHFVGDVDGYRPPGELDALRCRDPIPRYRERLIADGFDAAQLDHSAAPEIAEVDAAVAFARAADYPLPQEAFEHVFA